MQDSVVIRVFESHHKRSAFEGQCQPPTCRDPLERCLTFTCFFISRFRHVYTIHCWLTRNMIRNTLQVDILVCFYHFINLFSYKPFGAPCGWCCPDECSVCEDHVDVLRWPRPLMLYSVVGVQWLMMLPSQWNNKVNLSIKCKPGYWAVGNRPGQSLAPDRSFQCEENW